MTPLEQMIQIASRSKNVKAGKLVLEWVEFEREEKEPQEYSGEGSCNILV